MKFKPICENLAYIRFDTSPVKLSLLNVYAPIGLAGEEVEDKFYERVEDEIEKIPKEDTIIVLGGFNG